MRTVIVCLLLGAALVGGCDRQSPPAPQGNQAAGNFPAPVAGGKLDRSHKSEAAPAFAFTGPDGKQTTLADFTGKPLLVNLWATWCVPCIKELPSLDALAGETAGKLQILAISQDMKGKEKVDPFWAKAGLKHLTPYIDADMGFSMGMGANLPTTILYDAAGKEVWRVGGDFDWMSAQAKALIAEAG